MVPQDPFRNLDENLLGGLGVVRSWVLARIINETQQAEDLILR